MAPKTLSCLLMGPGSRGSTAIRSYIYAIYVIGRKRPGQWILATSDLVGIPAQWHSRLATMSSYGEAER